jgi:hypothetical protein
MSVSRAIAQKWGSINPMAETDLGRPAQRRDLQLLARLLKILQRVFRHLSLGNILEG